MEVTSKIFWSCAFSLKSWAKPRPFWVESKVGGAYECRILALNAELQKSLKEGKKVRTGIFTSGIVSRVENGHDIVLFFTGNQHAGENLDKVLKQRPEELPAMIQMSDALASNMSGELETIVANCLVHARRNFVEVVEDFPVEVEYVLTQLKEVYKNDAQAKKQNLNNNERLEYHQKHSQSVMDELKKWLNKQFDERLVEPNSSLGQAIEYMQNHWDKLTQFLCIAGAPLDNNIVERVLKRVILHRKNSLFYKTENGARVGDIWMSLIHTTELCEQRPFEYLVAIQRNKQEVKENPSEWMPWNYRQTIERLGLPSP